MLKIHNHIANILNDCDYDGFFALRVIRASDDKNTLRLVCVRAVEHSFIHFPFDVVIRNNIDDKL